MSSKNLPIPPARSRMGPSEPAQGSGEEGLGPNRVKAGKGSQEEGRQDMPREQSSGKATVRSGWAPGMGAARAIGTRLEREPLVGLDCQN